MVNEKPASCRRIKITTMGGLAILQKYRHLKDYEKEPIEYIAIFFCFSHNHTPES